MLGLKGLRKEQDPWDSAQKSVFIVYSNQIATDFSLKESMRYFLLLLSKHKETNNSEMEYNLSANKIKLNTQSFIPTRRWRRWRDQETGNPNHRPSNRSHREGYRAFTFIKSDGVDFHWRVIFPCERW